MPAPLSVYPQTLPGPALSIVQLAERRLLSDVTGGPQQARGVQRDYLGTQRLEWNLLDAGQAAALNTWWLAKLASGGAWFAATWPAPQGWQSVVRRFIGVPQWQNLGGGFWRVSAQMQVRGVGAAPRIYPQLLMGLRLDGNLNNESGTAFTQSGGITFSTASPKFGSGNLHNDGTGLITSSNYGSVNLGATDWQIEGWVRLNNFSSYHNLLTLQALVSNGATQSYGGNAAQIQIRINITSVPTPGRLDVFYPSAGSGIPGDLINPPSTQRTLPLVSDVTVPLSTWTHWAVVQDATSMRSYVNGTLTCEDAINKLYFNPQTPFTNQGVVMGAAYAGGGWPGVYAAFLYGDLDDVAVWIGSVTYTGTSFVPPTAQFFRH